MERDICRSSKRTLDRRQAEHLKIVTVSEHVVANINEILDTVKLVNITFDKKV